MSAEESTMTRSPCPTCKKPVAPRAENRGYPFCSPRCRAVDLGRWLGEEYRVPEGPAEAQEDELPSGQHPERREDA